jgi:hypothetical protein
MQHSGEPSPERQRVLSRRALLGLSLMVFSWLLWLPLPALAFLELPNSQRSLIAIGLLTLSQFAFWGGVLLAGREASARIRAWLSH